MECGGGFIDNFKMSVNLSPKLLNLFNNELKPMGKVQKYLDSDVINTISPYVPRLTGVLLKTGLIGTVIGSGLIVWRTPYAKRQYYLGALVGTREGLRGRLWAERYKADNINRLQAQLQAYINMIGGL